ncbi:MAG: hypothetical protein FWH21_02490 [Kiritimatiellaeota bacterium]|nr:hypothetical protein [Kiritimatiellota bacterium]
MHTYFLKADYAASRLRCTRQTVYNLIRGSLHGKLTSVSLVNLLNLSRRAGQPPVDFIPDDLMTLDDVARQLFPHNGDTPKARRSVFPLLNSKRRDPLPHYRLNTRTVRVRRASLQSWLEAVRRKERIIA